RRLSPCVAVLTRVRTGCGPGASGASTELGCLHPGHGFFGSDGFELAVERGLLELVEGLVQLVVVLLRQQRVELVGDAGADPHLHRLPSEATHSLKPPPAAYENPVRGDCDRLEQPQTVDGLGELGEVAGVLAVPGSDGDRVNRPVEFDVA